MKVSCPVHGGHEIYEGYRNCPFVRKKAELLADDYDTEPINILSTGRIQRPIRAERLGLIAKKGEFV